MKRTIMVLNCIAIVGLLLAMGCVHPPKKIETAAWQEEFNLATRTLSPTGRNSYFILEPHYRIVLASEDARIALTVLDETIRIGDITARVLEEREWEGDELKEVSRNFFAICPETKDVFYFGEDVTLYEDGQAVKADDAWRAYANGARPGMIMPGRPALGMQYYQEIAPGVAMDRAEVVGLSERLQTPAGTFSGCLKTLETSPLKPAERGFKTYAPGIGMIQDDDLLLVSYGFTMETEYRTGR